VKGKIDQKYINGRWKQVPGWQATRETDRGSVDHMGNPFPFISDGGAPVKGHLDRWNGASGLQVRLPASQGSPFHKPRVSNWWADVDQGDAARLPETTLAWSMVGAASSTAACAENACELGCAS
jgi:hypothetical protein